MRRGPSRRSRRTEHESHVAEAIDLLGRHEEGGLARPAVARGRRCWPGVRIARYRSELRTTRGWPRLLPIEIGRGRPPTNRKGKPVVLPGGRQSDGDTPAARVGASHLVRMGKLKEPQPIRDRRRHQL